MNKAKGGARAARKVLRLVKGATGVCPICHEYKALVADHDHETGFARGAICRSCNAGLGMFRERIESFQQACIYLKFHRARQAEERNAKFASHIAARVAYEKACIPKTPLGFAYAGVSGEFRYYRANTVDQQATAASHAA